MKQPSKSAGKLKEIINDAIRDLEITPKEYQNIMDLAQNDSILDNEEKALLAQFHQMLSNGTITRVRG
ncbi:MAG: hypothetical protein COS92_00525 [Desulfobacterales bacterium CG07_land_8_20_14_0_80_52_14]|nr:MAG: hypothetical protein COX20_05970 [Desulfobacterales bacterium CG23_combo_of_CG06-09_8_20_14_all_52_9]PIU50614.1 MAG: hypothetical protein COS92_00525 [Desulfobacterales bacterium CG07_land_8_20_14_0_80_52_14]